MGRWMGKAVRITAAVLGVVLGAVGGALFPAIAGAFSSPAAAGAAHDHPPVPQVVVLVVDKLAMEDFADFPQALLPLTEQVPAGAVGVMNVRTKSSANSANGHLSLTLGVRAEAGAWAGRALMAGETHQGEEAAAQYLALTGRAAHGAIVHLGVGELEREGWNAGGSKPLGALLKEKGLKAAVYGNGDVPGEKRRFAALLVMDEEGIVPHGDVGPGILAADPLFPGGHRTDYEKLAETLEAHLSQGQDPGSRGLEMDVIVVDLGDLARLEEAARFLSPRRARELREVSLQRIASFAGRILSAPLGPRGRVVYLISPSPSTMLGRTGMLLTPVLRWEFPPGGNAPPKASTGLLTSATTRREGIVTNGDFLPSVLNDLGIRGEGAPAGHPWWAVQRQEALTVLLSRYHEIKSVHNQRLPVIQPYFLALIALLLTGAALIVLIRRGLVLGAGRWSRFWRVITTAFLAFPAALLLLSLFPPAPLFVTWALILGLAGCLTLLVAFLSRMRGTGPAGLLGCITAALLAADISLGAPLMQRSLLGYDPVAGSRYYGIGNEYMGVLIGAALMGSGWLIDRLSARPGAARTFAWAFAGLFAGLTLLMIHPRLGINVGGAITAAGAAMAGLLFLAQRPLTLWTAVAGGAVVVLLVASAAWLDAYFMGDQASHLGQVVQTVNESGTDPLWALFGRKAAINLRLIRLTVWSRVVFAALGFLVVAVFTPNWFHRKLAGRYPGLVAMTKTCAVASLVALVANDSGVVAAATLLLWPVLTVLSVSPEVAHSCHSLA